MLVVSLHYRYAGAMKYRHQPVRDPGHEDHARGCVIVVIKHGLCRGLGRLCVHERIKVGSGKIEK